MQLIGMLDSPYVRRVAISLQVLYLTVAIAQHLSRTGNLIQIYSDPETFDARVAGITA